MNYVFNPIDVIKITKEGYLLLAFNDKMYEYQLDSKAQFENICYRNSFPKNSYRKIKMSLLNNLKPYQIK